MGGSLVNCVAICTRLISYHANANQAQVTKTECKQNRNKTQTFFHFRQFVDNKNPFKRGNSILREINSFIFQVPFLKVFVSAFCGCEQISKGAIHFY